MRSFGQSTPPPPVHQCKLAAREDGKTYGSQLDAYEDASSVPEEARESVAWALENRIFSALVTDSIHQKTLRLQNLLAAHAVEGREDGGAAYQGVRVIFSALVTDSIHPDLPVSRAQLAQILVALTAYNTGPGLPRSPPRRTTRQPSYHQKDPQTPEPGKREIFER